MRINPVGEFTSRIGLYKFWTDYRDHMDRLDAPQEPPAGTPDTPVEQPRHALHDPKRGARWFASGFMRAVLRRPLHRGGAAAIGDDSRLPDHGPGRTDESHKIIEPIPRNIHADRPIRPEKNRERPVAEMTGGRRHRGGDDASAARWSSDTARPSANMSEAVRQRMSFLILLGRKLGDHPFLRFDGR